MRKCVPTHERLKLDSYLIPYTKVLRLRMIRNEEEKINRMEVRESLTRKDLHEKLNSYKKVHGG